jgi:hypothetical protein
MGGAYLTYNEFEEATTTTPRWQICHQFPEGLCNTSFAYGVF